MTDAQVSAYRESIWNALLHYYPVRGAAWKEAAKLWNETGSLVGFDGDEKERWEKAYDKKKFLGMVHAADPAFYRSWFAKGMPFSYFKPSSIMIEKYLALEFKALHAKFKEERAELNAKLAAEFGISN